MLSEMEERDFRFMQTRLCRGVAVLFQMVTQAEVVLLLWCMLTIYNVMLVASRAFDIYNYKSRLSTLMLPDSGMTTLGSQQRPQLPTSISSLLCLLLTRSPTPPASPSP